MRKDIELHIKTGDTPIEVQNIYKRRDFQWTTNPKGSANYLYGEILVPATITESSIRNNGVYFTIPYTPKWKPFMMRIKRVFENGYKCVVNSETGEDWYEVKCGLYGGQVESIEASKLIIISDKSFYGKIEKDYFRLYSANQSDFNIIEADRQNANCLLACNPSNNYRYPLTGVGLVQWINSSHIESGGLAKTLQSEFKADGVTVNNAKYDYATQSIIGLDLDVTNAE